MVRAGATRSQIKIGTQRSLPGQGAYRYICVRDMSKHMDRFLKVGQQGAQKAVD